MPKEYNVSHIRHYLLIIFMFLMVACQPEIVTNKLDPEIEQENTSQAPSTAVKVSPALSTYPTATIYEPAITQLSENPGDVISSPKDSSNPAKLTDDEFLELLEHLAFQYFWNEANPANGLIKDRANNFEDDSYDVSSIAAVGFGLTALCIGKENEWISYDAALERVETTLRFFYEDMPHEHGFFYHFVNIRTGERVWNSEVSSIDTALFLAGALTVAQCFPDTEASNLANAIYERVEFDWMLTDGGALPNSLLLNHGWKPEEGFLPYRWDSYNELMILYILAIGSPTHPIPTESWSEWARPTIEYEEYITFAQGPLFTHQYSQAWIDFRDKEDVLGFNYFDSSIGATLANRQFAIEEQNNCRTYEEHVWGLTACDGPDGYKAYSAPPGYPNP